MNGKIPILPPMNLSIVLDELSLSPITPLSSTSSSSSSSSTSTSSSSTTSSTLQQKTKRKNYVVSQTVDCIITREFTFIFKFISPSNTLLEIKTLCCQDQNKVYYVEFLPLVRFFSNHLNVQRLIYTFKSPSEKCSMHKKMFLTKLGLERFINYVTKLKDRKNGIWNNEQTNFFILQCKSLCAMLF